MAKFEYYFEKYGEVSPYQIRLFVGFFLLGAWNMPSVCINYVAAPMDHWCDFSDVHEHSNHSRSQLKSLLIPRDANGDYESCKMYQSLPHEAWNENATTDRPTETCKSWQYDRSVFKSTIVSKYNLVCSREWLISLSSTLKLGGATAGALMCGFIADKIGRLLTLMIYLMVEAAAGLACAFATNYLMYGICQCLIGIGSAASWMCGVVLMSEEVGPSYRAVGVVGFNFAYSVGFCVMTGVAFLIRTTEYFQLALILPTLLYFSFWWLYVESPRWLLVVKQYDRARRGMKRLFAKQYREEIQNLDYTEITVESTTENNESFFAMFRHQRLTVGTLIILYMWTTVSLVWFSLSLNTAALPGDIFLVTFLMALVEIPAGISCLFLCRCKVTGRKFTTLVSFGLAGLCGLLCVPLLSYNQETAVTAMSLVGKFFISMAWSALYTFTIELYPTEVRNSATGTSGFCSYMSSMVAAFVGGPMGKIWAPLPYIIYGFLGITASLLCLYLPETLGKDLCETVEEAGKYGFVRDHSSCPAGDVVDENVKLNMDKYHDPDNSLIDFIQNGKDPPSRTLNL